MTKKNDEDDFIYFRYGIGLDIGQQNDPSAVAVVKKSWKFVKDRTETKTIFKYHCGYLKRWKLKTKFHDVIEDTKTLYNDEAFIGQVKHNGKWSVFRPTLAIDATGLGLPIVEEILSSRSTINAFGIVITGGHKYSRQPGRMYHVPKKDLIHGITTGLQKRILTISKDLTEAPAMLKELEDFRAIATTAGGEKLEHRSSAHDDLTLSLGMAIFILDRSTIQAESSPLFWK